MLYIVSTGMVCPVGLNAASACAAMRGGIAKFDELAYLDNAGQPVIGASVPIPLNGVKPSDRRRQKMVDMLVMAITDCLETAPPGPLEQIPLLVGLAEPDRPGVDPTLAETIIGDVQEKLGLRFHPELSRAIPKGHTAGFEALRVVTELVRSHPVSSFLVCGVDSYLNARSLLWLDEHWRLKTEENSDGVIPGEAAAAVLISRTLVDENQSAVRLAGLGFGFEQAHVLCDDPLLGLGLTEATRNALTDAGLEMHEIDFQISDVTGESYGFKDQALMIGRLLRVHKESFPIWHCAEFIGDTGAAAGIGQLVIASYSFNKNYAHGDRVMCFTSSVRGDRGAAVVERKTA